MSSETHVITGNVGSEGFGEVHPFTDPQGQQRHIANFSLAVNQPTANGGNRKEWYQVAVTSPLLETLMNPAPVEVDGKMVERPSLIRKGIKVTVIGNQMKVSAWNDRRAQTPQAQLQITANSVQILSLNPRVGGGQEPEPVYVGEAADMPPAEGNDGDDPF